MGKGNSSFKKFYDKHQIWINLLLIPIVGITLFWLTIQFMDFWTNHGKTAEMPKVVGLDFYKARDVLEANNFEVEVDSIYNTQVKYGEVLDQSPKEKEIVKYGRTVYLKINSFYPEMKEIREELLHISSIQATKILESLGITRIKIKTVIGDNDDEVIDVKYNGRRVTKGTKIPVTGEIELTVTDSPNNEGIDTISVETANEILNDSLVHDRSLFEE